MIIKGAARGNAGWLADHLERTDTNEVAEVVEIRGVAARTTRGAFREIAATALCTKARDPLYHANIDPRADETLTRAQWAQAVDTLEGNLASRDSRAWWCATSRRGASICMWSGRGSTWRSAAPFPTAITTGSMRR